MPLVSRGVVWTRPALLEIQQHISLCTTEAGHGGVTGASRGMDSEGGGAWRAMTASLLAPLPRLFRPGVTGNSQGQISTWIAHPDRCSCPSKAYRGRLQGREGGWDGVVVLQVPYGWD